MCTIMAELYNKTIFKRLLSNSLIFLFVYVCFVLCVCTMYVFVCLCIHIHLCRGQRATFRSRFLPSALLRQDLSWSLALCCLL